MTSCQCTATGEAAFVIPPGGLHELPLTLNLLLKEHSGDERERTEFSVNIMAYTLGQASTPFVWTLRGEIRRALDVSRHLIELGDVRNGRSSVGESVIRVVSLAQLERLTATTNAPGLRTDIQKTPFDREYELRVRVDRALPGRQFVPVELQPFTKEGDALPPTVINVSYRGVENMGYRPEYPHLGAISVPGEIQEQLMLFSRDRMPFRVTAMRTEPKACFLPSCSTSSSPLPQHSVTIQVQSQSVGPMSGFVEIDWEAGDASLGGPRSGTLTIPLAFEGVDSSQSLAGQSSRP